MMKRRNLLQMIGLAPAAAIITPAIAEAAPETWIPITEPISWEPYISPSIINNSMREISAKLAELGMWRNDNEITVECWDYGRKFGDPDPQEDDA